MIKTEKNIFKELYTIDVSEHVEKKDTGKAVLSYLSWPYAWAEVKKRYPDASYEIVMNENGLPYFSDPKFGIMVYVKVTVQGETHMMWLPVMDGNNAAMKEEPYEIETKYGKKTIKAASMFDINKTIMRCLVKALSMFGLGLYIYAGEDLPEESDEAKSIRLENEKKEKEALNALITDISNIIADKIKAMSPDEKKEFNKDVIVPIVQCNNYKKCTDITKLTTLKEKLSA